MNIGRDTPVTEQRANWRKEGREGGGRGERGGGGEGREGGEQE